MIRQGSWMPRFGRRARLPFGIDDSIMFSAAQGFPGVVRSLLDFTRCAPFSRPSAWLCLDALDRNIEAVNQRLRGKKLRVASKSLRCISVLKRIAESSPEFLGLMSYSARESAFLVSQGFKDVLCAYPSVDAVAIEACERACASQDKVSWMVDRPEHVALLGDIGRKLKKRMRVCIDLNLSMPLPGLYFGTRRSSVQSPEALDPLLEDRALWAHCDLVGVMGYEAQIAGVAAGKGLLSPRRMVIQALQEMSARKVSRFRARAVERIEAKFGPLELVNGGGSGSLLWSASQAELTEVTVGSAYFMPAYFSQMPSMEIFEMAAGFALPVSRKPSPGVVTCQSGGFVASGALDADKQPQIVHPPGLRPYALEGFGEVQTPLRVPKGLELSIGDCVWLRHAKAGELCEHFNELWAFREAKVVDSYLTYRGQGHSFH